MAPSNKKGAAGRGKKAGGKGHAEEKGEEVLQAVILADSFQDRFMPLTIDRPRCLLPLANTPIIEYTLEYLAMNGVQEVYVYCNAFADQVEAYLADSPRWAPTSKINPFQSLEFVRVAQATSMGDFMRDVDKRGFIEGDFLLVHGDLVANVPLDPILAKHKARREANHDAIMTLVLREAGDADANTFASSSSPLPPPHHTRAHGFEPVFVLDSATGRCLEYGEMTPFDHGEQHRLDIDANFLGKAADIEVRADLIDCGIDICTPGVLALWTDSFDCELPRKNFLYSVLKDWELNGKLIYTEVVGDSSKPGAGTYAARATNLQMYDAISRDILGGWTYPLLPSANLVPGHSYSNVRRRPGVSAERGVVIDASAHVVSAVLGLHASVGAGSVVVGSTIGRRCRIGNNVHIHNCYLWDDVVVGDNTVLTQSILASGVAVGSDVVVPAGSVLSFGVAVADGGKPTRAGSASSEKAATAAGAGGLAISVLARNGSPLTHDAAVVGAGGKGAVYRYLSDDDDEADQQNDDDSDDDEGWTDPETLQRSLIYSTAHLNLSTSSISSFGDSMDDDDYEGDASIFDDGKAHTHNGYLSAGDGGHGGHGHGRSRSRLSSFASLDSHTRGASGDFSADGGRSGGGGGGGSAGGAGGFGASSSGLPDTGSSSFHTDAVNGLLDALRDEASSDFESARLEFMGLRLTSDASEVAVRRAVAAAFARRTAELNAEGHLESSKAAEQAVKSKTGAAKFVRDVGVGNGTAAEQVEFVLALQRTFVGLRIRKEQQGDAGGGEDKVGSTPPGTLLAALLQQLYDNDVLEEDGILAWWADKRAGAGGGTGESSMATARERCKVLVEWLETAEEDDSDEDEDDDEESEDEESEDE